MTIIYENSLVRRAIEDWYSDHKMAINNILIKEMRAQFLILKNPPVDYYQTVLTIALSLFGVAGTVTSYTGKKLHALVLGIAKESGNLANKAVKLNGSSGTSNIVSEIEKVALSQAKKVRINMDNEAKKFWDMLTQIEKAYIRANPKNPGQNDAEYSMQISERVKHKLQSGYVKYLQFGSNDYNIGGDWRWDERMKSYLTIREIFKAKYIHRINAGNAHYDAYISLLRMNRSIWSNDIARVTKKKLDEAKASAMAKKRFEDAKSIMDSIFGYPGF